MQVYRIDKDGYYVEPVIVEGNDSTPPNCVDQQPPQGMYRARWTGMEWVDDISDQDLAELRAISIRQNQIRQLEILLAERYQAHGRLLATNASEQEIEEVKGEIALILEELGGLYNATTTQEMSDLRQEDG